MICINLNQLDVTLFAKSVESLREKLKMKTDALQLLGKQLELCNKEKSEHMRLIDTLYDKNLSLKKSLYFKQNQADATRDLPATTHETHETHFFFQTTAIAADKPTSKADKSVNKKKPTPVSHLSPASSSNALFNDIDSEVSI